LVRLIELVQGHCILLLARALPAPPCHHATQCLRTSVYFFPLSGSILAALDTFKKMWVSKQEYDENGQRAIDQKTF